MKLKHLFSFKVNKNLTTLDLLTIIYINIKNSFVVHFNYKIKYKYIA